VQDAAREGRELPGNMFVPIDLLKPEYENLRTQGASSKPPRPWLGMYVMEARGNIFVTSLTPDGPAENAGLEPGDMILVVGERTITSLADCYRKIWATGSAGVEVVLHVQREEDSLTIHVDSTDRQSFMKQPRRH
jgi:S1-C subfamily serine protease